LASLKEEFSDKSFSIYGLFADDIRNIEQAQEFKEDAGLEVTDLLISESILPAIQRIGFVPYIYFVDNVGEVIPVDAVGAKTLEELVELVNEAFELIE